MRVRSTKVPAAADEATQVMTPAPAPASPVKVRRRPAFLIASVAALLLGALGAVWLWTSTTSTTEVLAVRSTVVRGSTITAADLVAVQIGVDPAVQAIPASEQASIVGKRAALDMAAGGLVTRSEVTDALVPEQGSTVVGLALAAGFLPAIDLQAGDRVRVVEVPGVQGATKEKAPVTVDAVVVSVGRSTDGQYALVDVSVSTDAAAGLAAAAASGKVSVVLDSRER